VIYNEAHDAEDEQTNQGEQGREGEAIAVKSAVPSNTTSQPVHHAADTRNCHSAAISNDNPTNLWTSKPPITRVTQPAWHISE
jgi:hypothetical protein